MLRQRSVLRIAELADSEFTFFANIGGTLNSTTRPDLFAEFLFEHEFPMSVRHYCASAGYRRGAIKSVLISVWDKWCPVPFKGTEPTEAARERWFVRLGETLLARATARTGVSNVMTRKSEVDALVLTLALDGYSWVDGRIRKHEENVFDVAEQAGALEALWTRLGLPNVDQIRHNLRLVDEHYEAGRWGDCVSHARQALEFTFRQIADMREAFGIAPVPARGKRIAGVVRDHLRETGFYDRDEQNLVDAVYGLVSREGGHPNIAPQESARILRQHAFTVAHFMLLRFEKLHAPVG